MLAVSGTRESSGAGKAPSSGVLDTSSSTGDCVRLLLTNHH